VKNGIVITATIASSFFIPHSAFAFEGYITTSQNRNGNTQEIFCKLATLKVENGPEQLRFEVKTITPEKIADPDGRLFQPPADYHELAPLPC
jgi:hypothetical protein